MAMLVKDGPSTTSPYIQKVVWDYTTRQPMPLLLYPNYLSAIQEKRGRQGKLYLTSILQTVCIPLTLGIPVLGATIPQVRGSQMILRIGSPKVTAGQEWQASIEIKRGTKPLLPRIANRIVPVILRAASPFTRLFIQQA